jgi:hypothetical protein
MLSYLKTQMNVAMVNAVLGNDLYDNSFHY